jgi:actin-like ATPase involved in cell morphogenesis
MSRKSYPFCLLVIIQIAVAIPASAIDLADATIVTQSSSAVVAKAAVMLKEELAERCGISLPIMKSAPANGAVIRLGTTADLPDVTVPQ